MHFLKVLIKFCVIMKSISDKFLDHLFSVIKENFYVLDTQLRQFRYVKSDDLFLCNFPTENVLRMGYDFYPKIIHPEDLSLWMVMYQVALWYLKDFEETRGKIDYFSCTFRLRRKYCFKLPRSLTQMIYHRMKHIPEDNEMHYFICTVGISTCKEAGNLCTYDKNGLTYKKYDPVC